MPAEPTNPHAAAALRLQERIEALIGECAELEKRAPRQPQAPLFYARQHLSRAAANLAETAAWAQGWPVYPVKGNDDVG